MGGTTEEMMMPLTPSASILPMAKRLRNSTPYSSTVCVITVATRQCASRRGAAPPFPAKPGTAVSYTPSTVLVLPTSRTRSIVAPLGRADTAGNYDAQPLIGADAKEAARIQSVSDAVVASVFIHMHQLAL